MTQLTEHPNPDTLSAFIDGELSAREQQDIQQHLVNCHSCALSVLSATQLKAATARAGHRFAPTPEALARITAQLHPPTQRGARARLIQSTRPMVWTALAAAIVLALSIIGWRQIRSTDSLAAELLDQHLAVLSSGATPEVISSDRHTVKPWFQGRLPFSFNLPDTQMLPPDTILKGADLTYLNGQPAALLLFTIHKHQVSIFLTQRTDGSVLIGLQRFRAGFSIHTASVPGLRIIAVSDVSPADLDLLVAALILAQK
jgi:anti-sigma factor RsiW